MSASAGNRENVFSADHPAFYYITDRSQIAGGTLIGVIRRAIRWGVDCVQVREKDLPDRALFELTLRVVHLARGSLCRVLVNGRADIAVAAGADGVHLPSNAPRCTDLRSWTPDGFIVGVSVHSVPEAQKVAGEGVDYLLLSPVYRTPSKVRYGPPLGLEQFSRACRKIPVPVLGLGGMTFARAPAVIRAGGAGVAGISMFQKGLPQQRPVLPILPPLGER